jgi:hypothetical protein
VGVGRGPEDTANAGRRSAGEELAERREAGEPRPPPRLPLLLLATLPARRGAAEGGRLLDRCAAAPGWRATTRDATRRMGVGGEGMTGKLSTLPPSEAASNVSARVPPEWGDAPPRNSPTATLLLLLPRSLVCVTTSADARARASLGAAPSAVCVPATEEGRCNAEGGSGG